MQPFLSGETTMVYLLTILTFLFFVAAGTDHPVDQIHIKEPVHVATPVPCKSAPPMFSSSHAEQVIAYIPAIAAAPSPSTVSMSVAPPKDKKRRSVQPQAITSRIRGILLTQSAGVFINPNWRKHSIWSTWSVQGWNSPLWRRNYFGRKQKQQYQQQQYQSPKLRRHTISGINPPAVSVGIAEIGRGGLLVPVVTRGRMWIVGCWVCCC